MRGLSHHAYRRIRAELRQPFNVQPVLSNLARFALMRSSRPKATLSIANDPSGFIAHLYALRTWARAHDHSRCYCAGAQDHRCPWCTLRACEACDGDLGERQVCEGCLEAADDELAELKAVDRANGVRS